MTERPLNPVIHEPKQFRRRLTVVLINVICVGILLVLPEVLVGSMKGRDFHIPPDIYLKAAVYLTVFYLNYIVLVPKVLFRPRGRWRFLAINALLLLIAMFALWVIWYYRGPGARGPVGFGPDGPPPPLVPITPLERMVPMEGHPEGYLHMVSRDIVMLVLIVGLSVAVQVTSRWFRLKAEHNEMRTRQAEMELKQLKSQLNPHFLFNTLNGIYALISIDPDKAREAIHSLSGMLRHMLYDTAPTVPLSTELEFVNKYIGLMRMRIGNDSRVALRFDCAGHEQTPVAPLLFLNIVENTFKYGIAALDVSPIEISFEIKDEHLIFRTVNGCAPDTIPSVSGIGMANLQRRLDLLYPGRHKLAVEVSGGRYNLELSIDVSMPPDSGTDIFINSDK